MASQLSHQASGDIPRYLYRVYSVKLGQFPGYNSDIGFASAASRNNKSHPSLAKMDYYLAQAKLRKHLSWAIFPDDEFISWTSSLLWALQFAIRKAQNSAERESKVCVLDTRRFITGTFLPAPHLIQAYGLSAFKDCIVPYHSTEYLVHGSLNVRNCSKTVSLACLRENGLFDFMPEFDDEFWKQRMFLRVRNLRQTLASTVIPLSQETCQKALRIASLFGEEWTMAIMMAFLALRGTLQNSEVLLQLIRAFTEPKRDFLHPLPPYEGHYVDAPELAHFVEMMNWGYTEMQKIRLCESDALAHLNADLNDLRLGSDEVANGSNDTEDTTTADDSSLLAPQPTANQYSRRVTTTVVPLTLGGASVITVKIVERKAQHSDLPTELIVDEESEVRAAEDPVSSTTITLLSGRTGKNVIVSVEFPGNAPDGDNETEELSNEKSLLVVL